MRQVSSASAGAPLRTRRRAADSQSLADGTPALLPTNRKYLGSKFALAGWICDCIVATAGVPATFLDGFAGTGAVATEMARRGAAAITCVDNLLSNTVVLGAYFTPLATAEQATLKRRLAYLRGLPGKQRLMEEYGSVTRWDYHYPVFGRGAGVARRRTVIEHLFALHRG